MPVGGDIGHVVALEDIRQHANIKDRLHQRFLEATGRDGLPPQLVDYQPPNNHPDFDFIVTQGQDGLPHYASAGCAHVFAVPPRDGDGAALYGRAPLYGDPFFLCCFHFDKFPLDLYTCVADDTRF